jgi:nitrite reductase/ring-hydroxylating ferredoxin subunit
MSDRWFRVCKTESLKEGTAQSITILGKPYAVFNVGGKYYGMDAACRHMRANLAAGKIKGNIVTCFMHDWQYDICSGKCLNREGFDTTPRDVKIENNEIWISVSWPDDL